MSAKRTQKQTIVRAAQWLAGYAKNDRDNETDMSGPYKGQIRDRFILADIEEQEALVKELRGLARKLR